MKLISWKLFKFLPDKYYIKLKYFTTYKKRLNLKNPITFSEKIQWLKLYDRKPIYSTMVDKYEAKKYVANIIGDEYIIPTIGIYDKFEDIDFNSLPNSFVIKCTHDCGSVTVVKDKKDLNVEEVREKINRNLRNNYYYTSREWPYKNVKPRIIIEKYMTNNSNNKDESMRDYKFFCFDGVPEIMYLSEGMEDHSTASMNFYDMDFNLTDCKRRDFKKLDYTPSKPKTFEQMKQFASVLSKGIPHLRVDFYEIDGHIYFGELTFSTCSGFIPFEDKKWDKIMGDWLTLPNKNTNKY